jgi:hypothetical protein
MKKIAVVILLIGVSMVQNISVVAKDNGLVTKQVKISRHYNVATTDSLVISNCYGNVIINTWDKNEVTIDITETTKAKTKKRAAEIIDSIKIIEGVFDQKKISFITTIQINGGVASTSLPAGNDNWEADVTYRINAPKNIVLFVSNTNGNVSIGDFTGPLNIKMLRGALHAKNISGHDKTIMVMSHETCTIASIEEGHVNGGDGDLVITKPIDPKRIVLDGWRSVTAGGKPYAPEK